MNKKTMLINVTEDESRIAIIENQVLQELLIEHASREQIKGNIYNGVVVQIQTSVQAAFVDYGGRRHGFLPLSEVNPNIVKTQKGKGRNQPKLKVGQNVLVQVTREEVDKKGAALTTNITLAGRYMVMMPCTAKGGVSKKIQDPDERDRLRAFVSGIDSEEHSVIIRTAGIGRDLGELKKDYTLVKKHWEDIKELYYNSERIGLLTEEMDVITRTLRDYYSEDIQEIWVDHPEAFPTALAFLKENNPRRQKDLKLFVGERSLFASYNIEKQVEQLTSRNVKLPSGGSIVIDQTEAMVAIDVNSGKSNQDKSIDGTAIRTNLEAAEEVARQLRLRNLGGLVVIDFIDMDKEVSRREVEAVITKAMSRDRAQHKILPISQFGLMEISRQRMAQRISSVVESACPVCRGKGKVPSTLASMNLIIRSIRDLAARGNVLRIQGTLPLELANQLLNEKRQSIMDLEQEFGIVISLQGDPELLVFDERNLRAQSQAKPVRADRLEQESSERSERQDRSDRPERPERQERQPRNQDSRNRKPVEEAVVATESVEEASDRDSKPRRERRPRKEHKEMAAVEITTPDSSEASPAKPERAKPAPAAKPVVESKMHPGCLYTDTEGLSAEVLAEVKNGFQKRLSGNAVGQVPEMINEKFLWRTELAKAKGTSTTTTATEKAVEASTEASTKAEAVVEAEKPAKKPARGRKPAAKKTTKAAEDSSEGSTEEVVAKPARGRKPAAKKATTAAKVDKADAPADEKPKRGRKPAAKKPAAKKPAAKKATAKSKVDDAAE